MRPISRTALGAATAAVLAVTVIAPSVAAPPDERDPNRPITGSAATAADASMPGTLTLVTGDTVLVTTDESGASAATACPARTAACGAPLTPRGVSAERLSTSSTDSR
ncbi:hypothetical protein [Streptomyces sp. NPDC026589]|uniref:hypothetical protein n=1 Tax=Streptomyces sp. NPDC026589 TaxID=3155609 RepID=UPI0033F9C85E